MLFLKSLKIFFPSILFFVNAACQQKQAELLLNEKDYSENLRGMIDGYHTITFRNKNNPDYTIKKIYTDSLFNDSSFIVTKYFFYKDLLNGPTETYSYGKLSSKGYYQMNNKHGEFVTYDPDGNVNKKEYYTEGKRSGIWLYYNSNHILHKKIYYDQDGEFIKKELFNQRTGKFERTEYTKNMFD